MFKLFLSVYDCFNVIDTSCFIQHKVYGSNYEYYSKDQD